MSIHNREKYRTIRSSRRGSRRSDRLPRSGQRPGGGLLDRRPRKEVGRGARPRGPYAGRPTEHQMLTSRRRGHRFASGTATPSRSSPVFEPVGGLSPSEACRPRMGFGGSHYLIFVGESHRTSSPTAELLSTFMRQGFSVAGFSKPRRGSRISDFVADAVPGPSLDTRRWVP